MTIEIRVCKPIDENTSEWEHVFYTSNMNKAIMKIQELFIQEQQQNNNQGGTNGNNQ